ncbi:TPA: hypothetical protein ACH3X1_001786 [Trebouxia sp. C0004]
MTSVMCMQVVTGEADIDGLEAPALSSEELYQRLLPLPGVGPFTAANMLQLLGHYSRIPCDSETVRHLHKVHNLQSCTLANVQHHAQQVYAKYAPYQFLAYWHELWREYESLVGSFAQVDPECYPLLTGHNMRRAAKEGAKPPLLGGRNLAPPASSSPVQLQQPQLQAQPQLQEQPQPQTEARRHSSEADGMDNAASTVMLNSAIRSGSSQNEVADTHISQPATPPACSAAQPSHETACGLDDAGRQKLSKPHSQETWAPEDRLMHVSSALQSEGSVLNNKVRQPLQGSTAKGSSLRKRHAAGSDLQESVRRSQRVKMRISS